MTSTTVSWTAYVLKCQIRHGVRPNLALTVVVLGCAHCPYTDSSSAFIASFCSSGVYDTDDIHITNALDHFNSTVAPIEKLSVNSVVSSPVSQKLLSSKLNDYCFQVLFDQSFPANRQGSVAISFSPHATSW